jgi:hypothetical protein
MECEDFWQWFLGFHPETALFSFWLRLPVRDRTQTDQSSQLFINVLIFASSSPSLLDFLAKKNARFRIEN